MHIFASFCTLPHRRVGNQDIVESGASGERVEAVYKKTGIFSRRYARADECTSVLAARALSPALSLFPLQDGHILMVATTSPDSPSPATASRVHRLLHLPAGVHTFDVTSSCTSFLSALRAAMGLVSLGESVAVVASEVKHKSLDVHDVRTRSLFADGAGGVLLEPARKDCPEDAPALRVAYQKTSSQLCEHISIPVGGSREPSTPFNLDRNLLIFKEPKFLYRHTVKEILQCLLHMVSSLKERGETLGLIFIHQANKNILQDVAAQLEPYLAQKIPILMADVGNMVCASLPVLRSRVCFLRALAERFSFEKMASVQDILERFLEACARWPETFSYEPTADGLVFRAQWQGEMLFITDESTHDIARSWLVHLCPREFESLKEVLAKNSVSTCPAGQKISDLWIAAGGGFQTVGVVHSWRVLQKEEGHNTRDIVDFSKR